MSYSSVSNILRGLAKTSFAAGVLLLGLSVSGAQAATVNVFTSLANWQAAAGSPGVSETFGADVLNPPNTSAAVAFGTIDFGTTLPGNISGGVYNDRASNEVADANNPLLSFTAPGILAFGADWDLGPNDPGTGLTFLITFADLSTTTIVNAITNPLPAGFVGFFGIVSDMAINSIRLLEGTQSGNFETFTMDNVRVSAVPIPAALPLFLSAIAALGFLGRRRKKMAAA